MLFALLDQIHFAERTLIRHLLGLDVFRRKQQFFSVGQQHALLAADFDHLVALFEGHCQRLFADNMLSGVRDIARHGAMQVIGRVDGDHLDVFFLEHLPVIVEDTRDAVPFRERLRMSWSGRGHRHHFRIFGENLDGCRMNIRLKS